MFSPHRDCRCSYTENRLRQIFREYAVKSGIDREYGQDSRGRRLHELTIHNLRHSHIMHYIHIHKLPIAIVQKQVGHSSLNTLQAWAELKRSERKLGQPPSFCLDDHLAADLRNEYGFFVKTTMDIHDVLNKKGKRNVSARVRPKG